MTYEEYIAECQQLHRAYIAEQQAKIKKARKLWDEFEAGMAALDLKPLTLREIRDREDELTDMLRDVPVSHGDRPSMRASYNMHVARC